jgi:hypothetical protein
MLGASRRQPLSRSVRDAGRRATDNGPACVRRRAETAQPPRPGAARLRGRQSNSDLRLNASEKPVETTDRRLALIIRERMYPQYTKTSTVPLPGGCAALTLRLKLRADPIQFPPSSSGVTLGRPFEAKGSCGARPGRGQARRRPSRRSGRWDDLDVSKAWRPACRPR